MDNNWISVNKRLPDKNVVVDTKIEVDGESRMEQELKLGGMMSNM